MFEVKGIFVFVCFFTGRMNTASFHNIANDFTDPMLPTQYDFSRYN